MSIKNILLATRPLTPPWDEASKNFAYFLAKSIHDPKLRLHLLTVKHPNFSLALDKTGVGGRLEEQTTPSNLTPTLSLSKERGQSHHSLENLSGNCTEHPIYPANDENNAGFPLAQKIRLPFYLLAHGHEYDVIHYLFTPTKLNSFITKHFVSKKPKTIQTIATLREDLYTSKDWKQMFFADQLVTYSDYSKSKLERAGFKNVQRIYPGIDLEKYSPQPKDAEALKQLNITPEDFVILHNGEYVRLDATDMLVEMLVKHLGDSPALDKAGVRGRLEKQSNLTPTLSLSKERGESQHIIFIFGCRIKNEADRAKKQEVIKKLTTAGVIDHIRFTDTWKDMPTLYNLADVVVFPAGNMKGKFDIPLAIIEPYACAKPVILSDLPIFSEFSKPDFSVTIPAGDGETLWQAIEALRTSETKKKALGLNARAFVEQHFNLQNTAREYEGLYCSFATPA